MFNLGKTKTLRPNDALLDRFASYTPPSVHKWVEKADT